MNPRTPFGLLLSALLVAVAAHAAEITIYKQPNFTGSQVTLRGNTPNLANMGFQDQASSLVIASGRWELCTQPDFKGDCVTLGPGEYPALDPKLNHRVESAHEVGAYAAEKGGYYRYGRGAIDLYSQPGFRGSSMPLEADTPSLEGTGFNDRAASVDVKEGTWQLCSDSGYQGTCRVFAPGRYADLGYGMSKQVSSARLVRNYRDAPAVLSGGVNAPEYAPREGTSRVILFSEPGLRGESIAVSGVNGSLDRQGFNDVAASMVVEGGRWIFCTEPYFRGDCRVIGPGRYANLRDVGLSRSISSVRPAAASDVAPPVKANADIELFRGANFDGGSVAANRDVPRLGPEYNDRISSAVVSNGRWELCTEADYGGRCVVVGPGRYADLGGLDNQISSLRRIR